MDEFDLFVWFRWLLATVCTVYAVVVTGRSLWGWLAYFGSSRQTAILGRYTLVLLLRMRSARFAGELLQIAVLSAMLLALVCMHHG
ncbi:MAG: hypothetical protein KA354_13815 [Phycisphaerae bacterium]|nr:hypothetical protein [Phycisphaerae bacterium]